MFSTVQNSTVGDLVSTQTWRNKQFSSTLENSNQGVVKNYTIQGENYTCYAIFERRNTLIRGTIIVSFFQSTVLHHTTNKVSTALENIAEMLVNTPLVTSSSSCVRTHMTPGGLCINHLNLHHSTFTSDHSTGYSTHAILIIRITAMVNFVISYHVIVTPVPPRIFSSADITCSHEFVSLKMLVRDSGVCTTSSTTLQHALGENYHCGKARFEI